MLDFKELPVDGDEFELLVRELLFQQGMNVYWSGKGTDGGKDLLCVEKIKGTFSVIERRWLIQCKHRAHSGASVGVKELDSISDSCIQHSVNGYVLICSTYPSSSVVNRLESHTKNDFIATYWDSVTIERLLSTPKNWAIAQRFFPISANSEILKIYATESPNHWLANYRGYYFHIANRIGSNGEMHLESLKERLSQMENIKLPKGHLLRLRAVYYDDKNGNYTWYIDYLRPKSQSLAILPKDLAKKLGHSHVLEDGQFHYFDILKYTYHQHSDHFDEDHYDYYTPFVHVFRTGFNRKNSYDLDGMYDEDEKIFVRKSKNEDPVKNSKFQEFVKCVSGLNFVKLIRAVNLGVEDIEEFCSLHFRNGLTDISNFEPERFFSSWITFECTNFDELVKLIELFPQGPNFVFSLSHRYIILPGSGLDREENDVYDFEIKCLYTRDSLPIQIRTSYNEYLDELISIIDSI